jgi:hypothetical protein
VRASLAREHPAGPLQLVNRLGFLAGRVSAGGLPKDALLQHARQHMRQPQRQDGIFVRLSGCSVRQLPMLAYRDESKAEHFASLGGRQQPDQCFDGVTVNDRRAFRKGGRHRHSVYARAWESLPGERFAVMMPRDDAPVRVITS